MTRRQTVTEMCATECQNLWIAVIERAIGDARVQDDSIGPAARRWLFDPALRNDLAYVCQCAGLDMHWVRDKARAFIAQRAVPLARVA